MHCRDSLLEILKAVAYIHVYTLKSLVSYWKIPSTVPFRTTRLVTKPWLIVEVQKETQIKEIQNFRELYKHFS